MSEKPRDFYAASNPLYRAQTLCRMLHAYAKERIKASDGAEPEESVKIDGILVDVQTVAREVETIIEGVLTDIDELETARR